MDPCVVGASQSGGQGDGASANAGTPTTAEQGARDAVKVAAAGMDPVGQQVAKLTKGKQKRRCWEEADDVRAVHAVRSVKAHLAPRGKRIKMFDDAAAIFNGHSQAPFSVNGKALHDRFELVKRKFEVKDKRDDSRSGVEETATELDKNLVDVVDDAVDYERRVALERDEADQREQRLVHSGEIIRTLAMQRRRNLPASQAAEGSPQAAGERSSSRAASSADPTRSSRRRKDEDADDDDLVAILVESEKCRSERDKKRLELEERRLEQDREFHQAELARRDR